MGLRIDILTLFPEMFDGFCSASIVGRAVEQGLVEIHRTNIRDYAVDDYGTVDDAPFGGGPGMVLMCPPVFDAV
jgi:tRNA (guanine37-N1)-methyltransferase